MATTTSMGWWNFSPMYGPEKHCSQIPDRWARWQPMILYSGLGLQQTSYLSGYILREQPQSDPPGLVSLGCAPLQPNTCLWQMQELGPGENSP